MWLLAATLSSGIAWADVAPGCGSHHHYVTCPATPADCTRCDTSNGSSGDSGESSCSDAALASGLTLWCQNGGPGNPYDYPAIYCPSTEAPAATTTSGGCSSVDGRGPLAAGLVAAAMAAALARRVARRA